jgi:hypothetical protein
VAVDRLSHDGTGVTDQAGDLLNRHTLVGQQTDEAVPQLAGRPVCGLQSGRLQDAPERTPHVARAQLAANLRREHQPCSVQPARPVLFCRFARDASWRTLCAFIASTVHETLLNTHQVDWRQVYQGAMEPLYHPVFGAESVNRWLPLGSANEFADPGDVGAAFHSLNKHIESSTHWYESEILPGRLLVFDNQLTIHRGPDVAEPTRRRLLKLKLGGLP